MDQQRHYERLAPTFTQHWSYSPEFLDAGCGTGIYAARLADHTREVTCLDPSTAMLDHIPDDPRLVRVAGTVEQLAHHDLLPGELFDAILLKEVIHHLDDRTAAIHGLAQRLAPAGRLLVAMLPPRIGYPLFPAALDRYHRGKLTPDHVAAWMRDAGLHVTTSVEHYRVELPTERYLDMIRDRYLSLLADFTDTDLAAGIRDIQRQHPGSSIAFDDRFVFVLGVQGKGRD